MRKRPVNVQDFGLLLPAHFPDLIRAAEEVGEREKLKHWAFLKLIGCSFAMGELFYASGRITEPDHLDCVDKMIP